MKIKLQYPIFIPGKDDKKIEINTITLGILKAKHLDAVPQSIFDMGEADEFKIKPQELLPLIAALADIPIESAQEIAVKDLLKVGAELGNFLSDSLSQETGEN